MWKRRNGERKSVRCGRGEIVRGKGFDVEVEKRVRGRVFDMEEEKW